jgi:hypothetical protein
VTVEMKKLPGIVYALPGCMRAHLAALPARRTPASDHLAAKEATPHGEQKQKAKPEFE